MKFLTFFSAVLILTISCTTQPLKPTEPTATSNMFVDISKFPKRTITATVEVPMIKEVRTAFDPFGSGSLSIKEIYLSTDHKEIWVAAQLEIKNHNPREDIPVVTLSSSVPVHAPHGLPIKIYLTSKKHWNMYGKFNQREETDYSYTYLGRKGLVALPGEPSYQVDTIGGQVLFPIGAIRLYKDE